MNDTDTVTTAREEVNNDILTSVTRFLYREADLLDRWQFHEWL
jgi:3-phenylpropionate/cinnamic acid dioxygenase small subunit